MFAAHDLRIETEAEFCSPAGAIAPTRKLQRYPAGGSELRAQDIMFFLGRHQFGGHLGFKFISGVLVD